MPKGAMKNGDGRSGVSRQPAGRGYDLTPGNLRRAKIPTGLSAIAAICMGIAACSSTGESALDLNSASPAGAATQLAASETEPSQPESARVTASGTAAMTLPSKIAASPVGKPAEVVSVQKAVAPGEAEKAPDPQPTAEVAQKAVTPADKPAASAEPPKQFLENGGPILTAGTMPAAPLPAKKKSFLNSFFGAREAVAATAPSAEPKLETEQAKPAAKTKPLIVVTSEPAQQKPLSMASLGRTTGGDALPGVRSYESLFEIKRKSGTDDTSDIDLHEDEGGPPVRVASAAGLARLAPNGLLRQREDVDVSCLKPALVGMLRQVEARFGKKVVVTSGYRSPTHNRRVNGAQKSQHMYCAAADVQVPGVSKWELARFARSLQGRGGVGTYCHTESVHIDVGPERDWNWRCRRRG